MFNNNEAMYMYKLAFTIFQVNFLVLDMKTTISFKHHFPLDSGRHIFILFI